MIWWQWQWHTTSYQGLELSISAFWFLLSFPGSPYCLFVKDNDQFAICSLQWRKLALVLISGWRNSSISSAGLRAWSPMSSCWWPQCELWRCTEAGQAWVPTVLVKREGKWDCGGAPLRTALAPNETLVWFWHSPEKWQWRTYSFTFETSGYASQLVFERWALREPERLYRKPGVCLTCGQAWFNLQQGIKSPEYLESNSWAQLGVAQMPIKW